MWGNGRRLSALVIAVALLLCAFASSALANTCSDEALRTFSLKGVDAAFAHFHRLLEEKRCQAEPAFLVNLAQAYKSKSSDELNTCRALFAYSDALKSKSLLPAYTRVAKKGLRQTAPACERLRADYSFRRHDLDALLHNTSNLVNRGAVHLALREYRLLIEVTGNDSRPIRGFCKTARLILDERVLAECEAYRSSQKAQRLSETSGSNKVAAWTTAGVALFAAGAATWYGLEMFDQYDRALTAHDESKRAQLVRDEIAFASARGREDRAGQEMMDAQRLMYVSVAVAGLTSVAAFTLWQLDEQVSMALLSPSHFAVRASF